MVLLCVGLTFSAIAAARAGEPLPLTPREAVVLLTNGEIIHCRVTEAGDFLLLTTASSEIRLRRDDVAHVCQSIEEAYQHKHDSIAGVRHGIIGADDHLQLATWCLQYNLLGSAARELSEAYKLAPSYWRIGVVERQLQIALHPPDAVAPQPLVRAQAGADEAAQLTQQLPPGSIERFASEIQPLLVNRCTGSGCHSQGSATAFTLQRVPPTAASRRLTMQNLQAVLQQVNRDDVAHSRLLMKPARAHGGATGPIFARHELDHYQHLVRWVESLHRENAPPPAALARTQLLEAQPLLPPVLNGHSGNLESGDDAMPSATEAPDTRVDSQVRPAATVEEIDMPALPQLSQQSSQQQPGAYTPIDEFDPELFNRRFGPRR